MISDNAGTEAKHGCNNSDIENVANECFYEVAFNKPIDTHTRTEFDTKVEKIKVLGNFGQMMVMLAIYKKNLIFKCSRDLLSLSFECIKNLQ